MTPAERVNPSSARDYAKSSQWLYRLRGPVFWGDRNLFIQEQPTRNIHVPSCIRFRYSASPSRHGLGATPSSSVILSLDKTE